MQDKLDTLLLNLNRYLNDQQQPNSENSGMPSLFDLKSQSQLQNLTLEYNGLDFDPKLLTSFDYPQGLISLTINIQGAVSKSKINNIKSLVSIGTKLRHLTSLKALSIRLPTTSHTNLMIHHMPNTLTNIEDLDLEFVEPDSNDCEEFYVNSCLEWTAVMKKLLRFRLKSTRINYTYCSFMNVQDLVLENLRKLEWIDDSLLRGFNDKLEMKGDSWIECKKEDDFKIVFGFLIPERIEYFEVPLVFDGLSGGFALTKFLSLFENLSGLKELKLSIGFKLLDESDISAVEEAMKLIKLKNNLERISSTIYYRELSKNIPEATFSLENRRKMLMDNGITYIYYPKLR